MPQETLNIIIGALIGFIPSALIAIVYHLLQLGEKRKERERKVIENRFEQVEKHATELLRMINSFYMVSDNHSQLIEKAKQAMDIVESIPIYTSAAGSLQDKVLAEYVNEFYSNSKGFMEILTENHLFTKDVKDTEIEKELFSKAQEIRDCYLGILIRLDHLRKTI